MKISTACQLTDAHPIAKESPGIGTVTAVETREGENRRWIVAEFPAYGTIQGWDEQFAEVADTPPAEVVA